MQPEELAAALKRLVEWANEDAPQPEPPIRRLLRDHLGDDPRDLPIVSRALAQWDRMAGSRSSERRLPSPRSRGR